MNRMHTKTISILLCLLMITTAAAFAAGNKESGTAAKQQEIVTIEFFQGKPEAVDTFNALIDKFEQEYPHIKVTQVNVPDSEKVLTTRIAIDDIPDIFNAYVVQPSFKFLTDEGYVMDLTDKQFLRNVNPGILETAKYDGKAFAFPLALNTFGVFYNVEIFDRLGLSVPETWDEFMGLCTTLESRDITPIVLTDKETWTLRQQGGVIEGMLIGDQQAYFSQITSGAKKPSELMYPRIAQKMLELRTHAQDQTLGTDYGQGISNFANGQAAMFINGIWAIASITKANPDLQYDMFPLPAEKKEDTTILSGIDVALAVSETTEHPEEVLTFLEFLSQVENAQLYSDLDGAPSAITGVSVQADHYERLMEVIDAGKVYGWPYIHYPLAAYNEYAGMYQNLIAHGSVQTFLDEIDSVYEAALQQ
jgi:raffinose/stachyose/melibiose transport system substrate-binding protein